MIVFQMAQFLYSRKTASLTAEASELGLGGFPLSFSIKSPTGRVVDFKKTKEVRSEGDLQCMVYAPVVPVPGLRDVTLFND